VGLAPRALLVGLLVFVALPLSATGAGAQPQGLEIRDVDVEAYPTITVTLTLNREIDPDSIRLTENSRPIDALAIRPVLKTGEEVDIVLALDTSNSVAGVPLEAAVQAARDFVDSLPTGVPVGVVTFSNRARVMQPVTSDHADVLKVLGQIGETRRGTRLYDGLIAATELFSGPAQHNIVLLTDGDDTGSSGSQEAATAAAQDAGAAVYSVGLEGSNTDFPALRAISSLTGGGFNAVSAADLSPLYQSLAADLTQQLVVLYRSEGPAGAQVTLRVSSPVGQDSRSVLLPRRGEIGASGGESWINGSIGMAVVLALGFLAAFTLVYMFLGATVRGRRDRELARRMSADSMRAPGLPARPDQGPGSWIPDPVVQAGDMVAQVGGFKASLERKLERADLPVTPGEVVGGALVGSLVGGVIGMLVLRSGLFAAILAAAGGLIPFVLVSRALKRRVNLLQDQLPDVLMVLASSMRAGHSFLQALDTVSKELGEPAGPEFSRVVTEIRLGRSFEEAMTALGDRVGTEEFRWAMLAVNVQREVGGNLAEILDTLAETVRERDAVRRQVKVLSAEGRLSVKILVAMPFVMTLYMMTVNPDYMELLWTTTPGLMALAAGVVFMSVGIVWARKTVKIDV
jgi:tight adherence protein B